MKKIFLALFLASSVLAQDSVIREPLPSQFTPSPCAADTAWVCQLTVPQQKVSEFAAVARKYNLSQEWINAHWDEFLPAFHQICAKIASCLTIKDNNWVWCVDMTQPEFMATCERFPKDSADYTECRMFALTYWMGLGAKSSQANQSRDCMSQQTAGGERTLTVWIDRESYPPDYEGDLALHAYDSETHIPVRATFVIDGGKLTPNEGPVAFTGSVSQWKAGFKSVPNAQGHRDVVSPTATVKATNYKTVEFPIDMQVPALTVSMTPDVAKLKPGKNTITITAIDKASGKPARLRVMAGTTVLGNTNGPIELELARGEKRPEIWITSLYDRYNDVVVAPAQK